MGMKNWSVLDGLSPRMMQMRADAFDCSEARSRYFKELQRRSIGTPEQRAHDMMLMAGSERVLERSLETIGSMMKVDLEAAWARCGVVGRHWPVSTLELQDMGLRGCPPRAQTNDGVWMHALVWRPEDGGWRLLSFRIGLLVITSQVLWTKREVDSALTEAFAMAEVVERAAWLEDVLDSAKGGR